VRGKGFWATAPSALVDRRNAETAGRCLDRPVRKRLWTPPRSRQPLTIHRLGALSVTVTLDAAPFPPPLPPPICLASWPTIGRGDPRPTTGHPLVNRQERAGHAILQAADGTHDTQLFKDKGHEQQHTVANARGGSKE